MITIKHFMDTVEKEDGNRIWVEPIGLTLDLKKWCKVNHTLCHVAPRAIFGTGSWSIPMDMPTSVGGITTGFERARTSRRFSSSPSRR